jgi:la-related protein 1
MQPQQQTSPRRIAASPALTTDDSFAEERFMSTSSWEESFDNEERKPSSRPSSRTYDRRKQFDTTTPTLIDEDDDEEISQLQQERGYESLGARRTPGASMYKSTFVDLRRTPGAAKDPSVPAVVDSIAVAASTGSALAEKPMGMGFGFNLPTEEGNEDSRKDTQQQQRISWDYSKDTSTAISSSPDEKKPPPRGPFSFDSWGARSSGAFSPNILRLTEDIGNLLQDDQDDEYAMEIPNLGGMKTEVDWTGYIMEQDHLKEKPALPMRSLASEKPSRRRGGGSSGGQISSSFAPFAQQPKPRRNEVFEFGKHSREVERGISPQLLNFGGAFAPPGNTVGYSRPVASFGASTSSTQDIADSACQQPSMEQHPRPRLVTVPSQQQHEFNQMNLDLGGQREHALSFDSYHTQQLAHGTTMGGSYFLPTAPSPVYAYGSEMHATAREFVPGLARSSTPHFPSQQWPTQLAPGQHFSVPSPFEQGAWHSSSSYNYAAANFGYSMPPQASFGDPRSGMTPSPHIWQPPAQQEHFQGVQRSRSETPRILSASPHLSIAGSEHSSGVNAQGQTVKKETKRKQRGKKKQQQKTETSGTATKKGTALGIKKKGTKEDTSQPGSLLGHDVNEEPQVFAAEDPTDTKRLELAESPATRIAFKDFFRAFRAEERISFQKAEEFALNALEDDSLPESIHWRVYLELADLAKRSNRYADARILYEKVCQLQPYASQGWLEYSKLEEECGRMNRVMNILYKGLEFCEYSENLLTRAVKHQEKMGNLAGARGILARLKHIGIEKVWRTVLEGALLEARAGNASTARRVLKYLMHHVPWYGPLYLEAYRLEKDQGNTMDALCIVERGLRAIPRYGPLWFGAFRVCEEIDFGKNLYHMPSTMAMIERAALSISKELVWKVHLEAAQILERASVEQLDADDLQVDALLTPARRRCALTILTCPNNLRWKVWLAAARMELGFGNESRARRLFLRAHEVVPTKCRSSTLIECARLEDFTGDTALGRAILCKGRSLYEQDWKVWLECILLETRGGNFLRALDICNRALELHQGTGRLWATQVQLRLHSGRDKSQLIALKQALSAVPKSGEVWCEGGRIHLNPFSNTFDLGRARRHLSFATRFTPQYGDGFVELLRLELIEHWLAPIADFIWEKTNKAFKPKKSDGFEDGLTKYVIDVSLAISVASQREPEKRATRLPVLVHKDIVADIRESLKPESLKSKIDLNHLRLACVNADPNYGLLWFTCRRKVTDSPRRIIEDAAGDIAAELQAYAHLYLAALIRRKAVISTISRDQPKGLSGSIETSDPGVAEWEDFVDEQLHTAPSLEEIINPRDPTTGMVLIESNVNGALFATGLSYLNKHRSIETMTLLERKRALFGNDALFP